MRRSREGTGGVSTCASGMKVAFRAADGKARHCWMRENCLTGAVAVTGQQGVQRASDRIRAAEFRWYRG